LGGRPVIDGSLVKRWMELGVQKRQEVAGRVGSGVEKIREVVEGLGQGLGYL
jgi:cleavage and polyadenylation specificity factor subunit 1